MKQFTRQVSNFEKKKYQNGCSILLTTFRRKPLILMVILHSKFQGFFVLFFFFPKNEIKQGLEQRLENGCSITFRSQFSFCPFLKFFITNAHLKLLGKVANLEKPIYF